MTEKSGPGAFLSLYTDGKGHFVLSVRLEVVQKAKDKLCTICFDLRAVGEKKGKH